PKFYASARPTLDVIRQVAPTLQKLGTRGAPVVARLRPLTTELATFATSFDPVTKTLDQGAPDVLGVTEGWARATQARDAGSHVFRFGLTVGADTFTSLLPLLGAATNAKAGGTNAPTHATAPKALTASPPATKPATPIAPTAPTLPQLTSGPVKGVQSLLDFLLK
ncbi:MAG: Virulence factor Mce family protein, partial [Solirubrobacterales bacterium]|nr:Virulence factor Mce family protein [Solirubrobacterales bacterium]